MPVLAVAGEDVVVGLERGEAADSLRLLADVQVAVAADLRFGVLLLSAFFEAPDQLHLAVEAEQEVAVLLLQLQRLRRNGGGGWGSGLDRGCHLLPSILLLESTHLPIDGEGAGFAGGWGGGAGPPRASEGDPSAPRGARPLHPPLRHPPAARTCLIV